MNSLIIATNIVKRLFKNPKEALIVLLLPILLIVVFVTAIGGQGGMVSIGIVSVSNDPAAQWLVDKISQESGYGIVQVDEKHYREMVRENQLNLAIIVPDNLTEQILSGETQTVSFYAKPNNQILQGIQPRVDQYLNGLYSAAETAKRLSQKDGRTASEHFVTLLTNMNQEVIKLQYANLKAQADSGDKSLVIISTGFAIMFMMVLIFITMGFIQEDKRKLTMARMFVLPVKEWEIILGNLLGSLFLGLIQLVPIVAALGLMFHLTLGQMINIFIILLFFLLAVVGLGIGLSGLIKGNFDPVNIIATVITPTCILGGCFIPEAMLPDIINKAGYIVPQKWAIGAITQILNGNGLDTVFLNLLILLMFSFVLATFGLKTIRPMRE